MCVGDVDGEWDQYIFVKPPTAPPQPERINTTLGSRPSRAPADIIKCIRDTVCHEVTEDVLGAMMGPPPTRDPNVVRLGVAGLTLARSMPHPKEANPLNEANAHIPSI